jgi:hypothetical protein
MWFALFSALEFAGGVVVDMTEKQSPQAKKRQQMEKLLRRIAALPDGRYLLVITIQQGRPADWTVNQLGKVEGRNAEKRPPETT